MLSFAENTAVTNSGHDSGPTLVWWSPSDSASGNTRCATSAAAAASISSSASIPTPRASATGSTTAAASLAECVMLPTVPSGQRGAPHSRAPSGSIVAGRPANASARAAQCRPARYDRIRDGTAHDSAAGIEKVQNSIPVSGSPERNQAVDAVSSETAWHMPARTNTSGATMRRKTRSAESSLFDASVADASASRPERAARTSASSLTGRPPAAFRLTHACTNP